MLGEDEGILVAAMIYFFHLISGLIHCAMMPDVCVFSYVYPHCVHLHQCGFRSLGDHAVVPSCHDSKDVPDVFSRSPAVMLSTAEIWDKDCELLEAMAVPARIELVSPTETCHISYLYIHILPEHFRLQGFQGSVNGLEQRKWLGKIFWIFLNLEC